MQVGEEKSVDVKDDSGSQIDGVYYKISDKHRNQQNYDASYWTLTPDQEYELFKNEWLPCWISLPNSEVVREKVEGRWVRKVKFFTGTIFGTEQFLPKDAFALCVVNDQPTVVGRTKADTKAKGNNMEDKRSDTFIARFESDKNTHNKKWHGYPAAPNLNDHDIPDSCYLKYWEKKGYLPKNIVKRMISKLPKKK